MADEENQAPDEAARRDVGPDPIWGVCLGVFGVLNMAVAGALTRHWWFNFGELFVLVGAVVFVVCLAISSIRQSPLKLGERLRDWRDKD